MQERIVAARTIFFTEEGIFWQCAEKSSSEFKENVSTNWKYKSSYEPTSPESARPSKPGFNELVKSWRADAQEYVFRAVAISNFLSVPAVLNSRNLSRDKFQRVNANSSIFIGIGSNPLGQWPRTS